jgi:hypothetical protein
MGITQMDLGVGKSRFVQTLPNDRFKSNTKKVCS